MKRLIEKLLLRLLSADWLTTEVVQNGEAITVQILTKVHELNADGTRKTS